MRNKICVFTAWGTVNDEACLRKLKNNSILSKQQPIAIDNDKSQGDYACTVGQIYM